MKKNELLFAKIPPNNMEVESSILGILMLENIALHNCINKLNEDLFYNVVQKEVYKAIQYLYDKNISVDMITVCNRLTQTNRIDIIGGPFEVVKLTNSVVSSAHLEDWIKILQVYYLQRQSIVIGQNMVNEGYANSNATELLNTASSQILAAQENVYKSAEKDMPHYLFELAKQRDKVNIDGQIGINTGYTSLNALISGWVAPDLIILAARPAQGKTAFMLNTILNVLKQNVAVGIFSLEMSGEQLVNRLLSLESDIQHFKLRSNTLSEKEIPKLMMAERNIEKYKLHIDDTPSLNIRDLRSKATIMKRKYDIKFLCIDYLQLMSGVDRKGTRETEISEISRGCKIIAKELNIPVLALSQLSRAVESRSDKMPQLSDLRESGGIEQDADSVIFLMRPETYGIKEVEIKGETMSSDNVCVVKVGKNRHGSLKILPFKFVGETMKFAEYIS